MKNLSTKVICVLGITLLINVSAHAADNLIVANDGVDSLSCGTPGNPCRSISQAIHNAAAGATIIVGPGFYGDLNGNGVFTDPGDEAAEVVDGCLCMIKVDKQVSIFSRDGADVTIIDVVTNEVSAVNIQASGVVFGDKGKGFTIARAGLSGLIINNGANHVTVAGNRATGNQSLAFATQNGTSSNLFIGNVAVNNHGGFLLEGFGHEVIGNVSVITDIGGFILDGVSITLTKSVSIENPDGADVNSDNTVKGNSFIANQVGIVALDTPISFTQNNIFGNVTCGLQNDGDVLDAPKNFFGAATGPGTDPADTICGSGTITTTPFATKEIKVKVIEP